LFFERVFRFCWEIPLAAQDIRQLLDDKFDLLPVKVGTDPDDKARDLIHGFFLLKEQNNGFFGGRQAKKSELAVKTEVRNNKS
jgi:hypothetical protein